MFRMRRMDPSLGFLTFCLGHQSFCCTYVNWRTVVKDIQDFFSRLIQWNWLCTVNFWGLSCILGPEFSVYLMLSFSHVCWVYLFQVSRTKTCLKPCSVLFMIFSVCRLIPPGVWYQHTKISRFIVLLCDQGNSSRRHGVHFKSVLQTIEHSRLTFTRRLAAFW